MINGIGVFKWNEGKKFFGFYKNDKKNGFGIYNWENPKKIFVGFWINGKQNGIGKFMEKNKVKFGFWKNGKKLKWFNNENEMFNFVDDEEKEFEFILKMNFDEICNFIKDVDINDDNF